ncbi:MAG TPA: hypothetical protein VGB52_04115 [Actinomycetota bacterium]
MADHTSADETRHVREEPEDPVLRDEAPAAVKAARGSRACPCGASHVRLAGPHGDGVFLRPIAGTGGGGCSFGVLHV